MRTLTRLVFFIAILSSAPLAKAGTCYRADSVKDQIKGVKGEASLTYVTAGRRDVLERLILSRKDVEDVITDMTCVSRLSICQLEDGNEIRLIFNGENLKISSQGQVALARAEDGESYLRLNGPAGWRSIGEFKAFYGPECEKLIEEITYLSAFGEPMPKGKPAPKNLPVDGPGLH